MSVRLANAMERCIPTILDEWSRRTRGSELDSICEIDRAGDLADVLRAMADALRPVRAGSRAVDEFIEIAAAHGARRRAQGVHEGCLFVEYELLGATVPHALRSCEHGSLAPEDLASLEGGFTTAILAGLRGFHRGEFERRGAWNETLARVAIELSDIAPARRDPGEQQPPASR